ncbi:class I SAM-dependent methyltransferase [Streptomyces sp. NPDC050485]|uniref:class I SAM-dependent methyltransferase n=1 Tax=Streptomyces sp. NPDC050485 TaxID=3365617 RepID=UPI0037A11FE1
MPTIASGRSTPDRPDPRQLRDTAESFGSDAERYDRARPRYPDALVDRITTAAPGPAVLDVGCGTGIVARQFRAAGREVLGVEPDARMAAVARRAGTEVDEARFEAWDPAGRAFDAVVAGQTWHWIDPVAGAAKAAHALRPGGVLAVFWNVAQLPSEVTEATAVACRRVLPDSPFDFQAMAKPALDAYTPMFTTTEDGIRAAGGFDAPERWRCDWEWPYSRADWLDQLPTHGPLTRLPPDRLAEVLADVGAAIDALGGGFTARYATVAVIAVRTGTTAP